MNASFAVYRFRIIEEVYIVQKKSFSWGIIVLMLFLFFPVAIFMIIKKMTDEKFNYVKNGKSL